MNNQQFQMIWNHLATKKYKLKAKDEQLQEVCKKLNVPIIATTDVEDNRIAYMLLFDNAVCEYVFEESTYQFAKAKMIINFES
jgi:hypothetical protein